MLRHDREVLEPIDLGFLGPQTIKFRLLAYLSLLFLDIINGVDCFHLLSDNISTFPLNNLQSRHESLIKYSGILLLQHYSHLLLLLQEVPADTFDLVVKFSLRQYPLLISL